MENPMTESSQAAVVVRDVNKIFNPGKPNQVDVDEGVNLVRLTMVEDLVEAGHDDGGLRR